MKSYAKVGEALVEVYRDEAGRLCTKEVPAKEVAEIQLFDQSEMLGESVVSKLVEQAYNELTHSFKENIKNSVAKSLGFEIDRWDRGWSVDHCNGRMSEASKVVADQVKEYVKQVSIEAIPFDEDTQKMVKKAIYKEFQEKLHYGVREAMKHKADAYISSEVDAFLERAAKPMVEAQIKETLNNLVKSKMKGKNNRESQ